MRVKVRCTFEVEVEIPDDSDAEFVIEENCCPGTGAVGAALYRQMEQDEEQSVCWACNLKGKNEIIEIVRSASEAGGLE